METENHKDMIITEILKLESNNMSNILNGIPLDSSVTNRLTLLRKQLHKLNNMN